MVINDKSREVWNLLGSFKKQMRLTLEVVDKAIRYNNLVGQNLNQLKTTRYNVIMRELKDVQEDVDGENSADAEAA